MVFDGFCWGFLLVYSGGGGIKHTAVRTQAKEAECNRGRTTCRLASGALSGSSRSAGPESLPVGPACGFYTHKLAIKQAVILLQWIDGININIHPPTYTHIHLTVSIYPSIHLTVNLYPFIHPSTYLSNQQSIHQFIYSSLHPFNSLSIHLSTHPSTYLTHSPPYPSIHPNICLFICLSIPPSKQLSTYLSINPINYKSIYPFTYSSIHPPTYWAIHLPIHPCNHLSVYLSLSVCPSIHLNSHQYIYLSICLFIHPFLSTLVCTCWTVCIFVCVSYMSMVRSLRKSLCSGFSTSTTPHGYRRPRTFFPLASICWLEPTTANGILVYTHTQTHATNVQS